MRIIYLLPTFVLLSFSFATLPPKCFPSFKYQIVLSLYDFAATEPNELINLNRSISLYDPHSISSIPNGIHVNAPSSWRTTFSDASTELISVLVAVKLETYIIGAPLFSATNSISECGIRVSDFTSTELFWEFYCNNPYKTRSLFATPLNEIVVLSITFKRDGEKDTDVSISCLKIKSGHFMSYSYKVETIMGFRKFMFRLYGTGSLYQLAFLQSDLDKVLLAQYNCIENKPITCSNCVGPAQNLKCPINAHLTKINFPKVREYACAWPRRSLEFTMVPHKPCITCRNDCKRDYKHPDNPGCCVTCYCSNNPNATQDKDCVYKMENRTILGTLVFGAVIGIFALLFTFAIITMLVGRIISSRTHEDSEPRNVIKETTDDNFLENIRASKECKICYREYPEVNLVALKPCRHANVCENCIRKLIQCPFDRIAFTAWVRLKPCNYHNVP
eukprot:TRINITY_DN1902_c0_g1_i1.p1 TRINITY_DN1902_c0_g1~~TRINITY_DN1902_c0_g1_i1.p1  ORF type:complete len:447 (-),score=2.26 TRINITY_DN1902_c0_g1_i1:87-1427(-)